jgi:uncharacterized membrane protein (DUF485 family)
MSGSTSSIIRSSQFHGLSSFHGFKMSSLSDTQRSNARLGLWLFAVYLVLYLGFVFLSAFAAQVMERPVIAGLNLAIVYGFGLIIAAIVMALIYGMLCKTEPVDDSFKGKEIRGDKA